VVANQDPAAGTAAAFGSAVSLILSDPASVPGCVP
jgi:beta-lactam-binding protein with PASTA domain